MEGFSEKDLRDAEKFRGAIHREALEIVRRICPEAESVVDPYPVEAYFCMIWDYPGAWYRMVSIPEGFESRDALVDVIVRNTIAQNRGSRRFGKLYSRRRK